MDIELRDDDFPRFSLRGDSIPCLYCTEPLCPGTCLWATWFALTEPDWRCPYCGDIRCLGGCPPSLEEEDFLAETAPDQTWLCVAGHFHEDGLHCPDTRQEPPWGCPCSACQDGDDDEYEEGLEW